MLVSSLVLSLALMAAAEAGNGTSSQVVRVVQLDGSYSLTALIPDAAGEIASVTAELEGEDVALAESNAWVHGTASLGAPPAEGAEVTLTVYDRESAALASFSGSYLDGALTLSAPRSGGEGECASRTGCEEGESSTTRVDLDVLAATVFADGTVGLHLAGADAMSVAAAELSVVEFVDTGECVGWGRDGACIEWGATLTRTDAEVDLDELGVVWQSEALELDGVTEVTLKAWDAEGGKLDKVKLDLAPAWDDGGEGVNVLPVDEDPLTTVALHRARYWHKRQQYHSFTVVSDGWTLGDALPELAEIEVEGGETWEVPVNSYQVTSSGDPTIQTIPTDVGVDGEDNTAGSPPSGEEFLAGVEAVWVDGVALEADELGGRAGYIGESYAVALGIDDGGNPWASVTAWAADPDDLPAGATLTLRTAWGDFDTDVSFSEEVAVVFVMDVELATDTSGLDLLGKVKLRGAPIKEGKRDTLAKGRFAGQFGVDGDGEVSLGNLDQTGDTVSRGDILIGGEPIDIERTGVPPVLAMATCTYCGSTRMSSQLTTYR